MLAPKSVCLVYAVLCRGLLRAADQSSKDVIKGLQAMVYIILYNTRQIAELSITSTIG